MKKIIITKKKPYLYKTLLLCTLLSTSIYSTGIVNNQVFANELNTYNSFGLNTVNYSEQSGKSFDYHKNGINYLNSGMYTKAIEELTKALEEDPRNVFVRNNLSVAYNSRGLYLFNNNLSLESSLRDFRRSLYYLKYYDNSMPLNEKMQENIKLTEKNLENVLKTMGQDLSSQSRFKKAKELRGQGNFFEAIVEFNYAYVDPKFAKASYEALGDIMKISKLKKDRKAAEYYDKALTLAPDDYNLHLKFAKSLERLGNFELAGKEYSLALKNEENESEVLPILEKIWQQILINDPDNALAHMNMGVVHQHRGDFQKAMTEYKIAETLDPKSPDIRLNIGTLLQVQGNMLLAVEVYDSIIATYPKNKLAHYYKATALKKLGKLPEAIKEYEIALALDPKNSTFKKELFNTVVNDLSSQESLNVLYKMANANPEDSFIQYNFAYQLHKNKKNNDALFYYKKALKINPNLIDAYINIATIYKEKAQFEEAKTYLKKASEIDSNNKEVKKLLSGIEDESIQKQYGWAVEKYNQKDYTGALNQYLAIKNPTAQVYLGIGACYQALEKHDSAIENYKKSIEIDDTDPNAYYYLGTAFFVKKDYESAEEYYLKAKSLSSDNAEIEEAIILVDQAKSEIFMEKGLKLYNESKYKSALKAFDDALNLDYKNGYLYYYKGMTHDALKSYYSAITNYKKAIELSKDLIIAYYALGADYDILNKKNEAKRAFEQFIKNSGSNEDEYTKYAKQRIKQL